MLSSEKTENVNPKILFRIVSCHNWHYHKFTPFALILSTIKSFKNSEKKLEILLLFPMKSLSFMSAQGLYTHKKVFAWNKEICVSQVS